MIPETSSPLPEPQMVARRSRIAQLASIVFELIRGRLLGGDSHEFDGIEDAGLMLALRACSRFADGIDCQRPEPPFDDRFPVVVEGVDGNRYLIVFTLHGPGFIVHAARVRVTDLSMVAGHEGRVDFREITFTCDTSGEYSKRINLGKDDADMAFLIGMSLVIGFILQDDAEQNDSLIPLIQWIAPRREELRLLREKLPPSSNSYDEEGDQPF